MIYETIEADGTRGEIEIDSDDIEYVDGNDSGFWFREISYMDYTGCVGCFGEGESTPIFLHNSLKTNLCPVCKECVLICDHCGFPCSEYSEMIHSAWDEENYCSHPGYPEKACGFECSWCQEILDIDSEGDSWGNSHSLKRICSSCSDVLEFCESCGKILNKQNNEICSECHHQEE